LATPDPVVEGRYQLTFVAQTLADKVDADAYRAASGNGVNGFEGIAAEFEIIA
jgi:hypothetical protein